MRLAAIVHPPSKCSCYTVILDFHHNPPPITLPTIKTCPKQTTCWQELRRTETLVDLHMYLIMCNNLQRTKFARSISQCSRWWEDLFSRACACII
mmetsp:Transcript_18148/g.31637  ORF Transcript_18148/g.31637 Transcript_18148/m.31637 type:complete len:95 (-) Transcript_18148:1084-1368(-)